jgi:hypothetical protein
MLGLRNGLGKHGTMKAELRISIKDFPGGKTLKVTLTRALTALRKAWVNSCA